MLRLTVQVKEITHASSNLMICISFACIASCFGPEVLWCGGKVCTAQVSWTVTQIGGTFDDMQARLKTSRLMVHILRNFMKFSDNTFLLGVIGQKSARAAWHA